MRAILLGLGLILTVAGGCTTTPVLGAVDGGPGDAPADGGPGDAPAPDGATDGATDARDAPTDRCGDAFVIERIDASCSLPFEAPAAPPAVSLTVASDVDTGESVSVLRVFVDDGGALVVGRQQLVRVALSGVTTVIDNPLPAMTIDAAQGATTYGVVVQTEGTNPATRLCIIKDDFWPALDACPSFTPSVHEFASVRWSGAAYWTFGGATGGARRVAAYDETGALVEEHVGAPGEDELITPELLADQIVDGAFALPAGGCESVLVDVQPRTLDVPPVRTGLLPVDFAIDHMYPPPGFRLAASPSRAMVIYRGRCGDFVAGAPSCGYWQHAAPAPLLATVLGGDGLPVVVGKRLPDLPIFALHWDGSRFVALVYEVGTCGCYCDPPPPQGGALTLAALDEDGTVVAIGNPSSSYPALWAAGPLGDFAVVPGVGYVIAYPTPYGGSVHVALVTGALQAP
ncbi:MAG TPA: hypothetical protein VGQ83_19300 [Polyangia bacterium]|jgi:hypothetical protein